MFGLQVGLNAVLLKRRGRDRSDRADDRSPSERFPQRVRRPDLRGQAEHVVDLRGTQLPATLAARTVPASRDVSPLTLPSPQRGEGEVGATGRG